MGGGHGQDKHFLKQSMDIYGGFEGPCLKYCGAPF